MITDQLKELAALRAKTAVLEAQVKSEQRALFSNLHKQYGFPDSESLIAAIREASGKRRGRKPRAAKSAAPTKSSGRKARAQITDETRAEVKKLVEAGKTGAEIAKAVSISLPSVQNIKKALGLVKGKKK